MRVSSQEIDALHVGTRTPYRAFHSVVTAMVLALGVAACSGGDSAAASGESGAGIDTSGIQDTPGTAQPAPASSELTFDGVPWGTPRDEAVRILRERGYEPIESFDDNVHTFTGPGVELVHVFIVDEKLVAVEEVLAYQESTVFNGMERTAEGLMVAFGPPTRSVTATPDSGSWTWDGPSQTRITARYQIFDDGEAREASASIVYSSSVGRAELERRARDLDASFK